MAAGCQCTCYPNPGGFFSFPSLALVLFTPEEKITELGKLGNGDCLIDHLGWTGMQGWMAEAEDLVEMREVRVVGDGGLLG